MDGLGLALGSCCSFEIDGITRRMEPLRLKDFGEIEHLLLFRRPNNLCRHICQNLDSSVKEEALLLAKAAVRDLRKDRKLRRVDRDQVMEWINTEDGVVYTFWICFRCFFVTLNQAYTAFSKMSRSAVVDFVILRDQISGLDIYSAADWPDPLEGVRESKRQKRAEAMKKVSPKWRSTLYTMAFDFGISPTEFGDFTIYQLQTFCMSREELGFKDDVPEGSRSRKLFR